MEATQKKNKYEIDMCNGTIMDKLISFALPLMVSSILQLLFNAVDIIVVGRFTGSQALAAVGSTTALTICSVNLFIGVSLGANVLSARFYAAGKEREMSETVHTAMTFALISGIVMVFVGLFCTRGALELMDTPADVIDQAALYMKIYFCSHALFHAVQLRSCSSAGSGRHEASAVVPDHIRSHQCGIEPVSGHCFFHGCGGGSHCYSDLSGDLLCAGIMVPVYYGQLLPAADFKAGNKRGVPAADLSGGGSGGDPERSHQFLQCSAAVLGEFLWLHRHGRLYGGQ